MAHVTAVYLSGGFSKSKYLREKMKALHLTSRIPFQFPENPEQAVMVGALEMARAQENLAIHTIDADYGVTRLDFDPRDVKTMTNILEKGKKVLGGRVYEDTLEWQDGIDHEVRIYRDKNRKFLSFQFNQRKDEDNDEPDFHVRMQVTGSDDDGGNKKLQVTCTNKKTHECITKRKATKSECGIDTASKFFKRFLIPSVLLGFAAMSFSKNIFISIIFVFLAGFFLARALSVTTKE